MNINLLKMTASDYDMELEDVIKIYNKDPDKLYENLELFIKERSSR